MPAEKYRKQPIEIEAILAGQAFTAARDDWAALPEWLAAAYTGADVLFLRHPDRIEIKTLEGTMTANLDDWIVRGVKGELYPVKPDIFAATYQRVPDADPADIMQWSAAECRQPPTEPGDLEMAGVLEAGAAAVRAGGDPALDRVVVEKLIAFIQTFAADYEQAVRA